jgi:molecular chaperone DnaK
MELILGIDLGTTNSAVSIIRDGKPVALRDELGRAILPSVVGLDSSGGLLVGESARNQALLAPERTVRSIKRKMGLDVKVSMGEGEYSPQEISAMILRTLADRAEKAFGQRLAKAVITVPAYFNENQREATREAGSLAGLDVVRIINEPTAASLVYEPHSVRNEKLLVYDLGGGTFDVSIVQIEAGVIEVLASHGDTQLGGDDFDQLLLDHLAEEFRDEHGVDLRDLPRSKSRLLRAAEEAKKRLSDEAFTSIEEEFIAEKDGRPLNLRLEIDRRKYEALIEPLLSKTLRGVDAALADARLTAGQIDRVALVGGCTRTPLVHQMLKEQLHHELHYEIDPDLCVSLGAAVQGGLIAGLDVGPVLVDVTPHTLGIECVGLVHGILSDQHFSPIIARNTPLPATRSELYYTACAGQEAAEIHVLQGESDLARYNQSVGRFMLEGLDEQADEGSEILVRFELDLDGILKVTAQERDTGLAKNVTIENAISQFRASGRAEARQRLVTMFAGAAGAVGQASAGAGEGGEALAEPFAQAVQTTAKARRLLGQASADDAEEMRQLINQLDEAIRSGRENLVREACEKLDDIVFYLQDA